MHHYSIKLLLTPEDHSFILYQSEANLGLGNAFALEYDMWGHFRLLHKGHAIKGLVVC